MRDWGGGGGKKKKKKGSMPSWYSKAKAAGYSGAGKTTSKPAAKSYTSYIPPSKPRASTPKTNAAIVQATSGYQAAPPPKEVMTPTEKRAAANATAKAMPTMPMTPTEQRAAIPTTVPATPTEQRAAIPEAESIFPFTSPPAAAKVTDTPPMSIGENVATGGAHLAVKPEPRMTFQDLNDAFEAITGTTSTRNMVSQWQEDPEAFDKQTRDVVQAQEREALMSSLPDWLSGGLEQLVENMGDAGLNRVPFGGGQGLGKGSVGAQLARGDRGLLPTTLGNWRRGQPGGRYPANVHDWPGVVGGVSTHGRMVDILNQKSFQNALEDYYEDLEGTGYAAATPEDLWGGGGGGGGGGYSSPDPYWWMNLVRWNI